MYDIKSMKAEEFISHQEIIDTLSYAEENKYNEKLIQQILDKAREKGTVPQGSSRTAGLRD